MTQTYLFTQLSSHLVAGSLEQGKESVFRYITVAHVDDLLEYSSPAYIHCKIPLDKLLSMLPVTHARKIITLHGSSPGAQCTQKHLLMYAENHSCHGLRCNSYFTVFSVEESPRQLASKCTIKYKTSKKQNVSDPSTEPATTYEFPPDPTNASFANTILSSACKRCSQSICKEVVPSVVN